ncbi:MAG: acetate/propionate family kinase [Steroidobacteraceae bacterium]
MQLLVFNAGSSSLKFDLLESVSGAPLQRLAGGAFVDAADGSGRFLLRAGAAAGAPEPGTSPLAASSLAEAAECALAWLADASIHGRDLIAGVTATVHRIVHGGERFRATARLEARDLDALAELGALAPLHNPPALAVIAAVRRGLGAEVPTLAVFDTAYYTDLPPAAIHYAVPQHWRDEFGIRRYGFHGMAHRYLCQSARARMPTSRATARIVSLQLGRGCSVTATRDGRAIATSMGFTPLEGLVMGTRSGDLDPGALLYVLERSGLAPAEARRVLNEESGLLGLSGKTADMRELLALERSGDPGAALAIEIFCRRARHFLAAYIAELGGVDLIVFGGGIGENCPSIRQRIIGCLQWAGIALEPRLNAECIGVESSIATAASSAAIWVVPVDEASIMASEVLGMLR